MASSLFLSGNGDGYELQMGRWSRRLAPVFFQFSGAASGMRVLDVGCGTGSLSHALAADPRVQAIHGIDMSAIYVDHARRRGRQRRGGGWQKLPLDEGLGSGSLELGSEAADTVILVLEEALEKLSEEHGVVRVEPGESFRIGERVRVLPNHACVVSNLHDRVTLARGDRVEGEWTVAARGRVR